MLYLIAQTWLFLAMAMLVGIMMGIALMWTRKTERHLEVEAELRDVRNRGFTLEKEHSEAHERIAELEGLSPGERVARIGARENMMTQIETLSRELDAARSGERRAGEESERARREAEEYKRRANEQHGRAEDLKAKLEAEPLTLGTVDTSHETEQYRARIADLEGKLALLCSGGPWRRT